MIDAFSRIIRLGEGISASGRLSEAAIERAVEALRDLPRQDAQPRRHPRAPDRDRSLPRRRERRRVPATASARRSGIELEIIDRETEARLAATGCTPLVDPEAEGVDPVRHRRRLVRTGAARPLARRCRRGPPLPEIRGWISLPLGVVTLAERHGGVDVTREVFEAMVDEVAALHRAASPPSTARGLHGVHLLGTSGTVTTIAGVHLDLRRYDRRRVDGCWMSDGRGRPRWSSGCWR